MTQTPLTVYKASAGSGKTFTLASEYLKLLVADPQNYRSVLAVTFTNKATQEMKTRILSQLYGIWNGLADSRDYTDKICSETGAKEEIVRARAGEALRLLLNDYGNFRVETIDSFFQCVLRNLARELDLTANLRVELNDIEVEHQAVDRLIESLKLDDRVMKWVMDYIRINMEEDKGWNVIDSIKDFGETIFKDFYQKQGDKIMKVMGDDEFFTRFFAFLRNERNDSKEIMRGFGNKFLNTLQTNGLSVGDISQREKGAAGFFIHLTKGCFGPDIVGKRTLEAAEDVEKWASKTNPNRESVLAVAETQLRPLLLDALSQRKVQWRRYQSASLTLAHINQLRLLGSIEEKVRELNEEAGRFLLCHTQHILSKMIENNDSPFIFEKIGSNLEHIMIDEFQDTSVTQWNNFKVLLNECLSRSKEGNLIVGDVKQSIYRWRDGDWRLLNNIEKEWDDARKVLHICKLDTNYRSRGNIVKFNNEFFQVAARKEYENLKEIDTERAEMLKKAYSDVCQKVSSAKSEGGYVEITLLPKENNQVPRKDAPAGAKNNEEEGDKDERMLKKTAEKVQELLDKGIKERSIAILVRKNPQATQIADYFARCLPKIKIVSDEAFRLDASSAVCIIVEAMRLLLNPSDNLARTVLTKRYRRDVMGISEPDSALLPDENGKRKNLLPKEFATKAQELRTLPPQELAERLYNIFSLEKIKGQGAYICTFCDCMNEFAKDNPGDLALLLDYWDETMCKKQISSDAPDGIRVLTIHKSKGLEYDNVIVPFCDWKLSMKRVIWCRCSETPYDKLPLIPVLYQEKGMTGTVFEDAFCEETMQNTTDNLNLLYVAFTRAAHNLFVIGRKRDKRFRSQLIEDCLSETAQAIGASLAGTEEKGAETSLRFGAVFVPEKKESKTTSNVFLQSSEPIDVEVKSFGGNLRFRQSNAARAFISGDDANEHFSYIKIGTVLHQALAQINTANDVESVLAQMESDGLLGDTMTDDEGKTVTRRELLEMLRARVTSEKVKAWFSPGLRLFNECTILSIDRETGDLVKKRPDRVMYDGEKMVVVDFKFGSPRPQHREQVKEYMRLLQSMGYKEVKGRLWYVYSNEVVEVKD